MISPQFLTKVHVRIFTLDQNLDISGIRVTAATIHDIPVARRSTQLSIVLDFGLCPAGPHGCHTSISKGKGDHLAALTGRKNLEINLYMSHT